MSTFVDERLKGLNRRLRASAVHSQTLTPEERNVIRKSFSDATALQYLADVGLESMDKSHTIHKISQLLFNAGINLNLGQSTFRAELFVIFSMDAIIFAPDAADNCCIHVDRDSVAALLEKQLNEFEQREAVGKIQQYKNVYLDIATDALEALPGLSIRAVFLAVEGDVLYCCAVLATHDNEHRVFVYQVSNGEPLPRSYGYDSFHRDEANEADLLLKRPAVPSAHLRDVFAAAGVGVGAVATIVTKLAHAAVLALPQVEPDEYQPLVAMPEGESRRRAQRRKVEGSTQYIPVARLGLAMRRYNHGPRRGFDRRPLNVRFGVKGHYRNQAFGPKRQQRRRIWIKNHERGDENMPLRQEARRIPNPEGDEDV